MKLTAKVVAKDHGFAEFFKRMREARDAKIKVGVLADTSQGAETEGGDLTVAEIAVVNEFGTEDKRVPERSFLRSTFEEKREDLVKLGAHLFGLVIAGKMKLDRALGIMGATLASEVKNKITGTELPPPNAPSTIARKGSDHPLVDTGRLVGAITWGPDEGGGAGANEGETE